LDIPLDDEINQRWYFHDGDGVLLIAVVCHSLWRVASFKLVMSGVVFGNGQSFLDGVGVVFAI